VGRRRGAGPTVESEPVCPHCGYTLDKFREKVVPGRPNDYEVFEKQLSPLIKKAHDGATCHCGKVPSKTPTDSKKQLEIAQLRQQLDEAVRKEDYELAAKLRDKLNENTVLLRETDEISGNINEWFSGGLGGVVISPCSLSAKLAGHGFL
jgi:protein-arginine kinase activator protein McsA